MPLPINKADFLEGKLTTRWPSGNDLKVKFNFKILQRVKSVQVVRAVSFITHGFIWELSQSRTRRRKCLQIESNQEYKIRLKSYKYKRSLNALEAHKNHKTLLCSRQVQEPPRIVVPKEMRYLKQLCANLGEST